MDNETDFDLMRQQKECSTFFLLVKTLAETEMDGQRLVRPRVETRARWSDDYCLIFLLPALEMANVNHFDNRRWSFAREK